jgi:hypothetical protein
LGAVQNPETQNPETQNPEIQNLDRFKILKNWPALSFNAARN